MAFVQWSHDGPVASLLGILTELNTPHTNWYILLNPETVPVIGLRYFQVGHKFDKKKKTGVRFERFWNQNLEKENLREISVTDWLGLIAPIK